MTRKVFWDDPYRTDLAASVTAVSGNEVRLDETIFFAFTGGQERDHGTIGGCEVVDARWAGSEIIYCLAAPPPFGPGDQVRVMIDGERRSRLRRLHMATEIVLELFTQEDPLLAKVGAHIGPVRARIDFALEEPITPRLAAIEAQANDMIDADVEIVSAFSDETAERRYWEIPGFAKVPCSGTHPRTTGEIGPVTLRRKNPGKGKERVEIALSET